MEDVFVDITGYEVDFEQAKQIADLLGLRDHEMATLISWNDRERNIHSPRCLQCEIKGDPGWEVYGQNHDGRLRISVNKDAFVFIYS